MQKQKHSDPFKHVVLNTRTLLRANIKQFPIRLLLNIPITGWSIWLHLPVNPHINVSGFMSHAWQDWFCKILIRQYVHQLRLWATDGEIKKDKANRNYRYYFMVKPRKHQETSVRIVGPQLRFGASSTSKIRLVYESSASIYFRFS